MITPYTFTPLPFSAANKTKATNLLRSFALAHDNKRPLAKNTA